MCVRENLVLARNVANVRGDMRDEIQMIELAWGALVPFMLEGEGDCFLVRHDGEMPGL